MLKIKYLCIVSSVWTDKLRLSLVSSHRLRTLCYEWHWNFVSMELSVHFFRPINDLVFSLTDVLTCSPNKLLLFFIVYKNHVVQTFKMNVAVLKLIIPNTLRAVLMFEEELCWAQISGAPCMPTEQRLTSPACHLLSASTAQSTS